MDLGQTLFDTRSRPRIGFFSDERGRYFTCVARDHRRKSSFVREGKFDRLQGGRLHFSSNAGDRRRVTADLGILADAKQPLAAIRAQATA